MLLKNLLETTSAQNIKVGANSMFVYCGENNEQAKDHLAKYLEREVVNSTIGHSHDEPNTLIIKVVGNENGRYWTIKEFARAKAKVQIKKLKKVLTSLRAKLKAINGRTEQAKVQRNTINEQISSTINEINDLKLVLVR